MTTNENIKRFFVLLLVPAILYASGCGHRESFNLGEFDLPISAAEGAAELLSADKPKICGKPIAGGYPLAVVLNMERDETLKIPVEKRYYHADVTRYSGDSPDVDNPIEYVLGLAISVPFYSALIGGSIVLMQWDSTEDLIDSFKDDFIGFMPETTTPAQDAKAISGLRRQLVQAKVKDKVQVSTGSTYRSNSKYYANAKLVVSSETSRTEQVVSPLPAGVKVQLRSGTRIFMGKTDEQGVAKFTIADDRKTISELSGMVMDLLAEHDGMMVQSGRIRISEDTINDSLAIANKAYMDAAGTPSLPPRGLVTLKADNQATAGQKCNITLTVKNVGKGEFYKLVGVTQSSDPAFDGIEFPFGRLDPGETFSLTKAAYVPRGHNGGNASFRVKWMELNDYYPDSASARVSLVSLDRPKFATRVQVIDDNTGNSVGNSDGRIQKGEAVDLLVTIKNIGNGPAKNVQVKLEGVSNIRGVVGNNISAQVGDIKPGESAQCRLTVTAKKTAKIETLKARLRISDSYLGISSSESLNLAIDQRLPVSVMVYRATRYVGENDVVIRGGAGDDTPVIARATAGSLLVVTGELGDYLRVDIEGVGSGWVDKTKVSVTPPTQQVAADNTNTGGGVITVLENRGPVLVVSSPTENLSSTKNKVIVSGIAVDDRNIAKIEISLNGRLVTVPESVKAIGIAGKNAPDANRTEVSFSKSVILEDGPNEIEVAAWDDDGMVSRRTRKVTYEAATGEVYVVSIGIDNYHSVSPDLRYAAEDAEAVAECFRRNLGVPDENITLLINDDATATNIRYELADKMREKAREEDTVIIYFSGHGAPEADPASPDNDGIEKYLLPVGAKKNALYSSAIRMEEVRNVFRRIRSQRVIFLVDSCYSGMAGGRSVAYQGRFRSIDQASLLKRLSNTGRGRVIITASGGNEVSQEKDSLGHGVFTYYLLRGLDGQADANSNGEVTIDELFSFVSREVPKETGNAQHPLKALVEDVDGEMVISVPLVSKR